MATELTRSPSFFCHYILPLPEGALSESNARSYRHRDERAGSPSRSSPRSLARERVCCHLIEHSVSRADRFKVTPAPRRHVCQRGERLLAKRNPSSRAGVSLIPGLPQAVARAQVLVSVARALHPCACAVPSHRLRVTPTTERHHDLVRRTLRLQHVREGMPKQVREHPTGDAGLLGPVLDDEVNAVRGQLSFLRQPQRLHLHAVPSHRFVVQRVTIAHPQVPVEVARDLIAEDSETFLAALASDPGLLAWQIEVLDHERRHLTAP